MRYWWVNQKQTFKQEYEGGYLWAPKKDKRGVTPYHWANMTRVSIGDPILSYRNGQIISFGIAQTGSYDFKKPTSFGSVGGEWDIDGWRLDVDYYLLRTPVTPKEHLEQIVPLLPESHSPIQQNGNGNQAYLFEITKDLFDLLSEAANQADFMKDREDPQVSPHNPSEPDFPGGPVNTEVESVVASRRGQGKFRARVVSIEPTCRITGISTPNHLIASHIKPWRFASEVERLDGNNGLLLSPHIDHLFDKGLISFSNSGDLLISKHCPQAIVDSWNIALTDPRPFNDQQCVYLDYHRKHVFLG